MIQFGTGGWRAIIGDGFTKANVRLLVQGLCDRLHSEGVTDRGVVVGYDRRFLSREAAEWACEVFAGNGVHVTLVNRPAPTPMVMWSVENLGCAYGIAVTASHNPALYNGLKVFTEGGRDADAGVTDSLSAHINTLGDADVLAVRFADAVASGAITPQTSMNWYLDAIIDKLDMETIRHRHLHVVLDPMFGVAQTSLQTILMTARCQVDVINDRHDTLFGGRMPSPGVGTLQHLAQVVVHSSADLGIATDGDADRLGIIDDLGAYLDPNHVLVLLYEYLLTGKGWTGPAVRNMSTTHLLDRVAAAHGEACHEVPVGFKWVSAKMAETDAMIGGESSGGLTVRGHIAGKDGIYAGSLLVEMVAASGKKLSQLWADIESRYGRLVLVEKAHDFLPERRDALRERILAFTTPEAGGGLPDFGFEVDHVGWADGCKVYFGNGGWATIRFSGTEPVLRIFAEMEESADAEAVAARIAEHLGLWDG